LLYCRPKLKGTLFQKDLGTIYDKSVRVEAVTPVLAAAMGFAAAAETATAAAALSKADLATYTVTEMTALAGGLEWLGSGKQLRLAHECLQRVMIGLLLWLWAAQHLVQAACQL